MAPKEILKIIQRINDTNSVKPFTPTSEDSFHEQYQPACRYTFREFFLLPSHVTKELTRVSNFSQNINRENDDVYELMLQLAKAKGQNLFIFDKYSKKELGIYLNEKKSYNVNNNYTENICLIHYYDENGISRYNYLQPIHIFVF